jgi:SAM-dependent methyltransferase
MSVSATHEERLRKEAEFHDRWASDIDVQGTLVDETFTSITAIENQHVLERFGDVRGKRVMDYGCGAAEGGIFLAKLGARVTAVDVSEGMLETARRLAGFHGVEIETRRVTDANIPADANEFDFVYGNGVLHHVALDHAIPELARVLKPTGLGCFIEPLPYNPAINVYRHIAKEVRTDDEKPLSFADIRRFERSFDRVEHREFWLTTLAVFFKFFLWDRVSPNRERYWKKIYTDAASLEGLFKPLNSFDRTLLRMLPPLGRLCWNTVITVAAPRKETPAHPA